MNCDHSLLIDTLVTLHYTVGSKGSIMSWEARVHLRYPERNALTAMPSSKRKALPAAVFLLWRRGML
jgi:hypothetical protein